MGGLGNLGLVYSRRTRRLVIMAIIGIIHGNYYMAIMGIIHGNYYMAIMGIIYGNYGNYYSNHGKYLW